MSAVDYFMIIAVRDSINQPFLAPKLRPSLSTLCVIWAAILHRGHNFPIRKLKLRKLFLRCFQIVE